MRNDKPPLASVDRALRLVLVLRGGGPISVSDAAAALDISAPTAYRLLAALCRRGFAVQDPDRRYRAGPNAAPARSAAYPADELRRALRPSLAAVQAKLNETVHLWVLEGVLVRNLDGIESGEALAIRVNAWDRVPAYCSAAGKALLACLSNAEVERMHGNGLPGWRARRITSVTALKRHLRTVRRRGYATKMEEAAQGVYGIGVAVRAPDAQPVAGLSCGIPGVRFSRSRGERIAADLLATAAEMTASLAKPGAG